MKSYIRWCILNKKCAYYKIALQFRFSKADTQLSIRLNGIETKKKSVLRETYEKSVTGSEFKMINQHSHHSIPH